MTYQQQETVIKTVINLHGLLLIIRPLFQDTTFILTSHMTFIPRPNIYTDLRDTVINSERETNKHKQENELQM
jgi:hypothetical protein